MGYICGFTKEFSEKILRYVLTGEEINLGEKIYIGVGSLPLVSGLTPDYNITHEPLDSAYERRNVDRIHWEIESLEDGSGSVAKYTGSDDIKFPEAEESWGEIKYIGFFDEEGVLIAQSKIKSPKQIDAEETLILKKGSLMFILKGTDSDEIDESNV